MLTNDQARKASPTPKLSQATFRTPFPECQEISMLIPVCRIKDACKQPPNHAKCKLINPSSFKDKTARRLEIERNVVRNSIDLNRPDGSPQLLSSLLLDLMPPKPLALLLRLRHSSSHSRLGPPWLYAFLSLGAICHQRLLK